MMLDTDVVAVSPASVYRVPAGAGLLGNRNWKPPTADLTKQTAAAKVAMSRETEAGSAEEQPAGG